MVSTKSLGDLQEIEEQQPQQQHPAAGGTASIVVVIIVDMERYRCGPPQPVPRHDLGQEHAGPEGHTDQLGVDVLNSVFLTPLLPEIENFTLIP